jgi:hypothetical protein
VQPGSTNLQAKGQPLAPPWVPQKDAHSMPQNLPQSWKPRHSFSVFLVQPVARTRVENDLDGTVLVPSDDLQSPSFLLFLLRRYLIATQEKSYPVSGV